MSTGQNTKYMSASAQTAKVTMDTALAVSAAILIGTLIIAAVGFAAPEVVHSAAHDLRHAMVFPCH